MHFYALRIVCPSCGAASLLGGSSQHDLTRWRNLTVTCARCGAESSSTGAQAVDLRAAPPASRKSPRGSSWSSPEPEQSSPRPATPGPAR